MDSFALFRAWRADLAVCRPPTTARLYRRTGFAALADLSAPEDWTPGILSAYLDELTPAGAKLTRQALADFTSWMVRVGYRADDPLSELPRHSRRAAKRLRRGLSVDELGRVLSVLDHPAPGRWADERRRFALMVRGHFLTGLRPGEMCRLSVADVDLGGLPGVRVFATKTQVERFVPFSQTGVAVFSELIEDRVGRLFTFDPPRYHERFSRAAVLAGLPREKCRPYALRHSFGYQLAEAGVHVTRIAQLMGHSDVRVTLGYTIASDPELRAAVEMLRLPHAQTGST